MADEFADFRTGEDPFVEFRARPETQPAAVQQPSIDEFSEFRTQVPQPQEDSRFDQVLGIGKSLKVGAARTWYGMTAGVDRMDAMVADNISKWSAGKRDAAIERGDNPEGWKVQRLNAMSDMFSKISDKEAGFASDTEAARASFMERNDDLTKGMISEVAQGVGGMWDIIPAAMSAGLFTAFSSPTRMFDEGYSQAIATGQDEDKALDTATAYVFAASPLEMAADMFIFKGKGQATKRAALPFLKQVAKKMGMNFVSEGTTEVLQDAILNKFTDQKMFTPQSLRTFIVSGLVGSIAGGVSATHTQSSISRRVAELERHGIASDDAIKVVNMSISGDQKGATEFLESLDPSLAGMSEAMMIISEEDSPLNDKEIAALKSMAKKDVLSDEEEMQLSTIIAQLPADEQAIILDGIVLPGEPPKIFTDLISRLTKQEAQDATSTERKQTDEGKQEGRKEQGAPDTGAEQDGRPPVQVAGQERDGAQVEAISDEDFRQDIIDSGKLSDTEVVDRGGDPIVVYHGGAKELSGGAFISDKTGSGIGVSEFESGIFFSDSKEIADQYANEVGGITHTAALDMKNPRIADADGMHYADVGPFIERNFRLAKKNGNDGLIIDNIDDSLDFKGDGKGSVYVVFNPDQIVLKPSTPKADPKPVSGEKWYHGGAEGMEGDIVEGMVSKSYADAEYYADSVGGVVYEIPANAVTQATAKDKDGDGIPLGGNYESLGFINPVKRGDPGHGVIASAPQPVSAEKVAPADSEGALAGDIIGFSTAELNKARVARGEEELTEEEVVSHQTTMRDAIAGGYNNTADDLAIRVLGSTKGKGEVQQMSPKEVAGMGARVAELRVERSDLFLQQKRAMEAGNQELVDDLQLQIEQNLEKARNSENALKLSGTASGQANSMMASMINSFSYDVVGLTDAGRNAKGSPLTQEENASFVDSAEQIVDAENELKDKRAVVKVSTQIEKLQKRLTELKEQQKGKFRNIPKSKEAKVVSDEIKSLQDEIADVGALIRTEDKYADLLERIRLKKSLVPTKKERRKESKELTDAKVKLKRLKEDANSKVFALHKKTLWENLRDIITLPRAALATGDLSGALRQGMLGLFQNPKAFAKAFGKGLNATFNQYNADAQDIALREHPLFDQINELVTISNMDSAIDKREEMFSSHLIEKIPILGPVARASERNMVTLLNELRFGIMADYILRNPKASQQALERMGKLTDAGTGRGNARFLDTSGDILSVLAFAPRFAYSRVQAPFLAAKYMADPEIRGEVVKQWGSMLITGMTILTLAKAAGAEVGDDPEDSDWGKIIIGGNKRIDIWGGLQQPMRILLKAIKGGVEHATEGETGINPIADLGNYLKYKMSPPLLMANELISGKDIIGRETGTLEIGGFETPKAATIFAKNMFPIVLQQALDSYLEGESAGTTAALMAAEGLGLSIGVYDK